MSALASRDRAGRIHVTLSNLDPNAARTVTLDVQGATLTEVTGRILTGATMDAHNTFESPEVVKPVTFTGARVAGGRLSVAVPAHSVVALELNTGTTQRPVQPPLNY